MIDRTLSESRPLLLLFAIYIHCTLIHGYLVMSTTRPNDKVILVKIGGSSITDKGRYETVNQNALSWFVQSIKHVMSSTEDDDTKRFIIVHGAGSFGHHTAKEYGLKGITSFPSTTNGSDNKESPDNITEDELLRATPPAGDADDRRRHGLLGLGRTRISVQKLNQIIVQKFLDQGIPAVGISPCFGMIQEASFDLGDDGTSTVPSPQQQQENMRSMIRLTIDAGLVPVLHGDAGLFFRAPHGTGSVAAIGPAILSGDTILQILGTAPYITHVVFITDVDGVYTSDPKANPETAVLIPTLFVDPVTSSLVSGGDDDDHVQATESSHDQDVTGGLKVCIAFHV